MAEQNQPQSGPYSEVKVASPGADTAALAKKLNPKQSGAPTPEDIVSLRSGGITLPNEQIHPGSQHPKLPTLGGEYEEPTPAQAANVLGQEQAAQPKPPATADSKPLGKGPFGGIHFGSLKELMSGQGGANGASETNQPTASQPGQSEPVAVTPNGQPIQESGQ